MLGGDTDDDGAFAGWVAMVAMVAIQMMAGEGRRQEGSSMILDTGTKHYSNHYITKHFSKHCISKHYKIIHT